MLITSTAGNARRVSPLFGKNNVIPDQPEPQEPRIGQGTEKLFNCYTIIIIIIKTPVQNRKGAVLDSLLLTSVSQLSSKIRQSVDKTAGKIKILFKDRNWNDIESKLSSESDIPLLKTTNKEISTILTELKRVEKQIQAINIMVDPDGTLDVPNRLTLVSPIKSKPKASKTASKPALD
ncbi:cep170-like protein [Ictalurus punctatus]|uniref:Cep170-like protein n=1 Tax=Ictalurus punctatus TaxID=7998 RepID=A0A9F7TJA3_ICTPU|nr:cep170-like protein [Ictalurus punctatus]